MLAVFPPKKLITTETYAPLHMHSTFTKAQISKRQHLKRKNVSRYAKYRSIDKRRRSVIA